jgi:hypothetical protein
LERLRTALDGKAPHDEFAIELAAKQAEVLALLRTAGERPTVKQLEPAVALQFEISNRLEGLAAPEAPGLLFDAREAVKQAVREGGTHEQIVRRARDAAEALALLADRMNDREPERDRVRRLAASRRQGECIAKKLAGRPRNPDASTAARVELNSESGELILTRVGAAGQVAKKKAFDLYMQLQSKTEPDRQAADQRQLADALIELAAVMNDVAVLTTRPAAPPPEAASPADSYLPSRGHVAALRLLAHGERELRPRINGLGAELATPMKPAGGTELARAARLQLGLALMSHDALPQAVASFENARVGADPRIVAEAIRANENSLAVKLRDLAADLAFAAEDLPAGDPRSLAFTGASESVAQAQRAMESAAGKTAQVLPMEAANHRAEAERSLNAAAARIGPASRPSATEAHESAIVADAVRDAERAMRRAVRSLGPNGDRAVAAEAMTRAADALRRAASR